MDTKVIIVDDLVDRGKDFKKALEIGNIPVEWWVTQPTPIINIEGYDKMLPNVSDLISSIENIDKNTKVVWIWDIRLVWYNIHDGTSDKLDTDDYRWMNKDQAEPR